jgi:TetR/AcrR family transcriptional regulator, lmrAB and yxaGH operons repressor
MSERQAIPTRARMIDAAVEELRRHGVAGMSFTDVLEASGAARGAIYHHFPGGKAQLVVEAAGANAEDVRASLAALPASRPLDVVRSFIALIRPVVEASVGGSGCAVAALTVGPDRGEGGMRAVADEAFSSWIDALAERLTTSGLTPTEATELATTLLIMLEGAHVVSRAAASIEPFDRAARTILALAEGRLSVQTSRSGAARRDRQGRESARRP